MLIFPVQASVLCLPRQVDGKVSQSAALCLALGSPVAGSRISPCDSPFPSILVSEDADRLTQLHRSAFHSLILPGTSNGPWVTCTAR